MVKPHVYLNTKIVLAWPVCACSSNLEVEVRMRMAEEWALW